MHLLDYGSEDKCNFRGERLRRFVAGTDTFLHIVIVPVSALKTKSQSTGHSSVLFLSKTSAVQANLLNCQLHGRTY